MADPTPPKPTAFDTAPRLQPTVADPAAAYAPIAWSAVAALAVGVIFVAILLLFGISAFRQKEPLIMPTVFALPLLGIAVAFVARRQIAASDGTRIGIPYAAAGWWLCVVGGLIYAAYLGTLEYTVRADAAREFREWTAKLPEVNLDATDQAQLFSAFFGTLPPQARVADNPDAAQLDEAGKQRARDQLRGRFAPQLLRFRQHPVVQQAVRYGAECTFTTEGLRDWRYQAGKIECALAATMRTPEGDFPLVIPMEAMVTTKGAREWQVKLANDNVSGFPLRTPFGRLIGGWVLRGALDAMQAVLGGQQLPKRPSQAERRQVAPPEFAAGIGPLAPVVTAVGPFVLYEEFSALPTLTGPGGLGAPPDAAAREFRAAWANDARRFAVTEILSEILAEDPTLPLIELTATRLTVKVPFQYHPKEAAVPKSGVRMRLVLECTDPTVLGRLNAARASAATDDRTPDKPGEVAFPGLAPITPDQWRPVRIESDLKVLVPPSAPAPPGMGGGPGG